MWGHTLDSATPISVTVSQSILLSTSGITHMPLSSQAHRRSKLHSVALPPAPEPHSASPKAACAPLHLVARVSAPTPPPRHRKPAPLYHLHHHERPCGPLRHRVAPPLPDNDPRRCRPAKTFPARPTTNFNLLSPFKKASRLPARLLPFLLPPTAPLPIGQLVMGPLLPPADPLLPSRCSCK
jgi:hypothetical protein